MNLSHEHFLEILGSLKGPDTASRDQRTDPRVGMRAALAIAPICDGKDAEPGPAFGVRLQDVSEGGVAFHHHNALLRGKLFVLDLPVAGNASGGVRILCRVQHCKMVGDHQFFIGAEFVQPWTAPAPTLDQVRAAA